MSKRKDPSQHEDEKAAKVHREEKSVYQQVLEGTRRADWSSYAFICEVLSEIFADPTWTWIVPPVQRIIADYARYRLQTGKTTLSMGGGASACLKHCTVAASDKKIALGPRTFYANAENTVWGQEISQTFPLALRSSPHALRGRCEHRSLIALVYVEEWLLSFYEARAGYTCVHSFKRGCEKTHTQFAFEIRVVWRYKDYLICSIYDNAPSLRFLCVYLSLGKVPVIVEWVAQDLNERGRILQPFIQRYNELLIETGDDRTWMAWMKLLFPDKPEEALRDVQLERIVAPSRPHGWMPDDPDIKSYRACVEPNQSYGNQPICRVDGLVVSCELQQLVHSEYAPFVVRIEEFSEWRTRMKSECCP